MNELYDKKYSPIDVCIAVVIIIIIIATIVGGIIVMKDAISYSDNTVSEEVEVPVFNNTFYISEKDKIGGINNAGVAILYDSEYDQEYIIVETSTGKFAIVPRITNKNE